MEYTYQEKCVAAIECKLWWRFPNRIVAIDREWSRVTDDVNGVEPSDLNAHNAEYHIGDKPPRVLSDLERELLEALEASIEADEKDSSLSRLIEVRRKARAVIAKAKGEA